MSNQWGSLNGERGKELEVVAPSGIGARDLSCAKVASTLCSNRKDPEGTGTPSGIRTYLTNMFVFVPLDHEVDHHIPPAPVGGISKTVFKT